MCINAFPVYFLLKCIRTESVQKIYKDMKSTRNEE